MQISSLRRELQQEFESKLELKTAELEVRFEARLGTLRAEVASEYETKLSAMAAETDFYRAKCHDLQVRACVAAALLVVTVCDACSLPPVMIAAAPLGFRPSSPKISLAVSSF